MPIKKRSVENLPMRTPHQLHTLWWHNPSTHPIVFGKDKFHAEGKRVLKELAKIMRVSQFSVRSTHGGQAVMGEVTLHTPFVYLQILGSETPWGADGPVMYRSVTGMSDYTGGPNMWLSLHAFDDLYALAKRLNHFNRSNV